MLNACAHSDTAVLNPNVSHPSKWLSPVNINILVAGISVIVLLVLVLAAVFIRRRRAHLRTPPTPDLPFQSPPGISPSEFKSQDLFYSYGADPEKAVEHPLSAVRPTLYGNGRPDARFGL